MKGKLHLVDPTLVNCSFVKPKTNQIVHSQFPIVVNNNDIFILSVCTFFFLIPL